MNTLIADRTPTKKIDICFCFEGDFPALYVTRLTATTRYLVRKRGSANRQTAYPRSQQKKKIKTNRYCYPTEIRGRGTAHLR